LQGSTFESDNNILYPSFQKTVLPPSRATLIFNSTNHFFLHFSLLWHIYSTLRRLTSTFHLYLLFSSFLCNYWYVHICREMCTSALQWRFRYLCMWLWKSKRKQAKFRDTTYMYVCINFWQCPDVILLDSGFPFSSFIL
jgi:hypothetical protein